MSMYTADSCSTDDKGTTEPPANTAQESPPSAVAHPNRAGTPNSGRRNGSNDLAFEHPEVSWGDGYRYTYIYIYILVGGFNPFGKY